jgi:ADP-ribose pyrophosphatase YjhB (NUDIX family)
VSADSPPRLRRPTAAWLRLYRTAAWLTQPKFTLGSMAVVRRPGGELLLVRQRLRAPSLWGFPGGFQKVDESAADAARRELREEVGLDVPISAEDQVAQYQQPWARHLDTVFAVHHDDRAAPARRASFEILEVGWFAPDRLPPLTREAVLASTYLAHPDRSG